MARPSARTFRFRRRNLPCEAEQTLAATLSAHGVRILGRSIRYHRPRAPFCGVGYCTQCLVRVNGVPNIRSCTYAPAPGDAVGTENGWPSVDRDLLGAIDWLFPHGIDTLRGFRRPAAFRGLYHRVIRSLAGYGRPPTPPARPEPRAGERIDTELLVVGAGPAGRAAAARLASAGHQVLLVDRGPLLAPPPQARARAGTT
ncbi:MAG: (2Fe-2S)-binding protein, partial [Thermoplasmata archaeon]|nr:(2Fe-2S)-binding protein [Thermoplasmata archaeon]